MADAEGVDLLAVDARPARDGIAAWHNPALWHRSKQEITPAAGAALRRPGRCACSRRSRGARTNAWCSISTTRCGAAWSATTASRASCSARAARSAKPLSSSRTMPRTVTPRRHPRGVLEERRGERAGAVRAASGDGAASATTSPASSPTGRDKADNLRAIAEELNIGLDSAGLRRRQPVRAQPGAAGTADGGGAGGAGRPGQLSRDASPMPAISRALRSPTRTASALANTRATDSATR